MQTAATPQDNTDARLSRLEGAMEQINGRFTSLEARMGSIEARMASIEARMAGIGVGQRWIIGIQVSTILTLGALIFAKL